MLSKDIETSLPFPFSIMLIYKDASLADLNELMLCIERSLKATQLEERLELDRRIGQLLGYSTQDIEFYIQHISNRHLKLRSKIISISVLLIQQWSQSVHQVVSTVFSSDANIKEHQVEPQA